MRKSILFIAVVFLMTVLLNSQSVSQVGFIIKKAIPGVKEIVVFVNKKKKKVVISQATMAQVITKKKFLVYTISSKYSIKKKLRAILNKKNIAVYVVTDKDIFVPEVVKEISGKLNEHRIPLFSNRDKDTMVGALLSVFNKNNVLEKHVNQITASIIRVTIPEEFLKTCIIDVE